MENKNSTPKDLAKVVYDKIIGAKGKLKPSEEILNNLFETLFYTSLKTEESQLIKVTITLIDSNDPDPSPPGRIVANRWNCIHFSESIPFNTKNLVKLSKAADPWSSSLAVDFDEDGDLKIWGMIDQAVHYQSFINFEAESGPEQPGLFQTTITGIGSLVVIFDYELLATLKQNTLISTFIDVFRLGPISDFLERISEDRNEMILEHHNKISDYEEDYYDWPDYCQSLVNESISRILLHIQNYKHGGAILITRDIESDLSIKHKINYDRFSESINSHMKYVVEESYHSNHVFYDYIEEEKKNMPTKLYLAESVANFEKRDTRDELKGAIRFISSLSCIDGLVVFSQDLTVNGFGAVIQMREFPSTVYISKTSIIRNDKLIETNSNHFGTRHRSMFSYCWNNPGSLGFVISQDGDMRAIMKVQNKIIVWENLKVQRFFKSDKLKRKLKK